MSIFLLIFVAHIFIRMNYTETLDYLYRQLPMYQRTGAAALKNNLDNTQALDLMFDHPHRRFKSIHVAGTNGKGSVSHMLASVFHSAGYKVGLYTSPHLLDFRERIKINGQMIGEDDVCRFVEKFRQKNQQQNIEPSFFELTVLMAFDYFARQNVDVAIIEVGLGGRLDSTNIISPLLSVITNISLDHTNLLGNSIAEIAAEKAGIIKAETPVVIGETNVESESVFVEKARLLNAPLYFADKSMLLMHSGETLQISTECNVLYKDLMCDLKGIYQDKNMLTVLTSIERLKKHFTLNEKAVRKGLANVVAQTGLAGRWQKLASKPSVFCDTGHNPDGIKCVVQQIAMEHYERLHVVFGTVNDKDLSHILPLLPKNAVYYFAKAGITRALDENSLKEEALKFGLYGNAYATVTEAFRAAKNAASENDMIFVGGSTFVVAEVLE